MDMEKLRRESWIQFAMLALVLVTALLTAERRMTRVETLIMTYESRLGTVEKILQRHIESIPEKE